MPKFQLNLIFWNFLVTLMVFIIVLFQISKGMLELNQMGMTAGFAPDHPYFQFVRELSGSFYVNISIGFIVGIIVSGLITLFASHRLAGPLYRLKIFFEKMSHDGKVSDINFRKGDYLNDYSAIINMALKKISKEPSTVQTPKSPS
jgi:hypothetical protein